MTRTLPRARQLGSQRTDSPREVVNDASSELSLRVERLLLSLIKLKSDYTLHLTIHRSAGWFGFHTEFDPSDYRADLSIMPAPEGLCGERQSARRSSRC